MVLVVWVLSILLIGLGALQIWAAARAERWRAFLSRAAVFQARWLSPRGFARVALCAGVFLVWMGVCFAAMVVVDPEMLREDSTGATDAGVAVVATMVGGLAVLGVLALVLVFSGRPHALVLRPLRTATKGEAAEWLQAGSPG
ncbi:hypothetical protein IC607_10260 [Cellulomonas sp. JH27-2]|uniref:hypothetical protein n=1 Tax=Cellulomonas sp. JH27-2 TaxID=2774139 RepID=UPI00177A8A37|nr:hypothetical protein [Cellulomonas sp. JH27-2]MBD8059349.1 hypothetical protein [Cellulomonas sp. JH27-2]